jgi:hypothetical protein
MFFGGIFILTLGVFIIFTPRAESPEEYYYHARGRAVGRAGGVRDFSCNALFHLIF